MCSGAPAQSGDSGRSQLDGSHTPFKMWSDWLSLCKKGIVMHCSVDSSSHETFSSVLPCSTVLLLAHLLLSL